MTSVRLELGSRVQCSDGPYGELGDIVVDPSTRRVTHVIVVPHHRHDEARLLPIERVHEHDQPGILVDYTAAELAQAEPVQRSAFVSLGESPVEDPLWEVGIQDILALPDYQSLGPDALAAAAPLVGVGDHVVEVYDRIPSNSSEIRRESAVISADGHGLGRVDGFVVNATGAVTHLVLEHGHLWGKREVSIPVGAVKTITTDEVRLGISKDEVGELPSLSINRRSQT